MEQESTSLESTVSDLALTAYKEIYGMVSSHFQDAVLEDYEPYTRISPSHKILLLPISEFSRKKQMISIINEEQLSVRQFKDYLAKEQPASTQISKYQSKADQYKNVLEEIQTAIENLQEGGGENTNGEETGWK